MKSHSWLYSHTRSARRSKTQRHKPRHEAWPQCLQNCSATMVINLKGILRMLLFLVIQKVAAVFSFVSWSLRFYILTIILPSPGKGNSSSLTLLCLLCQVIFFVLCFEHFNVSQSKSPQVRDYSQLRCFCGMFFFSSAFILISVLFCVFSNILSAFCIVSSLMEQSALFCLSS